MFFFVKCAEKMIRKNCVVDYLELKLREQDSSSSNTDQLANDTTKIELFSALSWGHNDQRLFVACSKTLHVLRVYKEIPKLSLLSETRIKTTLSDESCIAKFCLPEPLKEQLKYCFASTIKVIFCS
jgi:hypothetical protein